MTDPGSRRTTGPRAAGLAVLTLLAVALIGGAAGYALGRRPRPPASKRIDPEMTLLGDRSSLLDPLALSPPQRAEIDSLLDAARGRADSAVNRMVTEVRELSTTTRLAVRARLEPVQQIRFDSLVAVTPATSPRSPLPPRRSR